MSSSLERVKFKGFENILFNFLGYNCINPPDPPADSKMKLVWNQYNPPTHDETVTYECDAGGTNKFLSDFDKEQSFCKYFSSFFFTPKKS